LKENACYYRYCYCYCYCYNNYNYIIYILSNLLAAPAALCPCPCDFCCHCRPLPLLRSSPLLSALCSRHAIRARAAIYYIYNKRRRTIRGTGYCTAVLLLYAVLQTQTNVANANPLYLTYALYYSAYLDLDCYYYTTHYSILSTAPLSYVLPSPSQSLSLSLFF